jgi:hypothetical protein
MLLELIGWSEMVSIARRLLEGNFEAGERSSPGMASEITHVTYFDLAASGRLKAHCNLCQMPPLPLEFLFRAWTDHSDFFSLTMGSLGRPYSDRMNGN